jgi:hydrogenase nickel incorporation protein HypA/HybF
MHEVGVAQEILNLAFQNSKGAKITRLGITLGNRSGVDRSTLEFALSALGEGTDADGCAIEFTEIKTVGICAECGKESRTDAFFARCPNCGSPILEYLGGRELSLDYVDVEE